MSCISIVVVVVYIEEPYCVQYLYMFACLSANRYKKFVFFDVYNIGSSNKPYIVYERMLVVLDWFCCIIVFYLEVIIYIYRVK